MKKLSIFLAMILVVLTLTGCAKQGEKPYKDLIASDVISATVRFSPPGKTIQIDDIEKMVTLLNDIVIYEEDNTYGENNGQLVLFTLTMTNGSKQELQAGNPFFVINGTGYKTKYRPCEKLANYANELLSQAVDVNEYEKTISYAGWSDDSSIIFGALNSDKMSLSSVQHFPIFKMDSKKDLENFKTNYGDTLSMSGGYDEIPSFENATSKYNEDFFENNSLFIVYVTANSGSYRFDVDSVYCDDDSFDIHIKQTNNPETHTNDMAGWFVTVAVKDDIISTCRFFDADLFDSKN